MTLSIHDCLMAIEKRAERVDDDKLIDTFVDAAPLLASVSNRENQIIFGRRGTGKTHLLKYISDNVVRSGDISIYIDLRSVGSNGSIYGDRDLGYARRATPLLLDVLGAIHDSLLQLVVENSALYDLSVIGPRLDELADAISTVQVVGSVEKTTENTSTETEQIGADFAVSANAKAPSFSAKLSDSQRQVSSDKSSVKRVGSEFYHVSFGSVQTALRKVIESTNGKRIWLLLDEWSEIPLDIQPFLADLLRRCVIPLSGISLKIAAIEHRSNFIIRSPGAYVGLELGADAGGGVNLDDFMVFDNDADRSVAFFKSLLFKHYRASDGLSVDDGPKSPDAFIQSVFTQVTAFEEFVRAVEGVPRDAVYLMSALARRAYERQISVQDVRAAARDWYSRDKTTVLRSDPSLNNLLHWVITEVIAHRRSRAFLLKSNQRYTLIETLFDSRLLHLLKKNISSNDDPGTRYDVYKLDYGCYVDLITTSRAPSGLLPFDGTDTDFVEVPPDDYRSIRRAILDFGKFDQAQME